MRKLFLEGKALELISHLMAYHFGGHFNKKRSLPQKEAKQIECARTILLAHMENPLPLSELARAAGLSETKLTRGFRRVYGSSVFAYLRRHRLEKARMLLESGNFNVTETALASGYSSPSHFTRSFTACYGLNPGEYLSGFKK